MLFIVICRPELGECRVKERLILSNTYKFVHRENFNKLFYLYFRVTVLIISCTFTCISGCINTFQYVTVQIICPNQMAIFFSLVPGSLLTDSMYTKYSGIRSFFITAVIFKPIFYCS